MPTLGNCAGVGVEIPELPTPLGTGSLVLVPSEPLGLGCKERLRACRFCRKIKPGLGGGGDQVPYLDGDATCPRDQPTCDSGEFTNKEVSVRVGFLGPMDQGAVPTRSGSVRFPACIHNTNPAWHVGSVLLVRYSVNFCTV